MLVGFGLLAIMIVLLPGTARTAPQAAAVVDRPVSNVLGGQDSARLQGFVASPARPFGYNAHVTEQSDPARFVGLIEGGGATSLRDDVNWASVEPTQGRFVWSAPDEIVAQAVMGRVWILVRSGKRIHHPRQPAVLAHHHVGIRIVSEKRR